MKTVEIIGYNRASLGKAESKRLREEGNVPCVLYGGKEQIHFHSPMILFRDLVYTPDVCFVALNIEGHETKAILQDVQYHPVSEIILHADFLEISDKKPIKMNIPIRTHGIAPGVQKGGKLQLKNRHLVVKALPADMPEFIDIDISKLDLGDTFRVYELGEEKYEVLTSPRVTIAMMNVPRGAREFDELDQEEAELEVEGEVEEAAETTEGGEEAAED